MQNEVNSICPASFSLASDYTLTTGSTAVVDAGLPQGEMPVDLAGWYRDSSPEIGAFEAPLTDTPSEVCTYTDGRLATRTMGVKTLSYTYDAAGRLQTFADSNDSGNDVTNTYDHLGRRIAMEIGGVEKYRFVYDGEDVIAEYFDSNNDGDVADPDDYKRVYWILPEIDQRVGFLHIQNGTTNFYACLTDQVGSILQIVDSDGTVINQYDYDAFGNINPANSFEGIPNRYTFQGREWDEHAGHYYFRNRTYIPEWGCFTSPDMNLANGILGEPNGIGNYLFCENNPLMYRDPRGLDPASPWSMGQYSAAQQGGEQYDPFKHTKTWNDEFVVPVMQDPAERAGFLTGMKINLLVGGGILMGPLTFSESTPWYLKMLFAGTSEGAQWYVIDNGMDRLTGTEPDYSANAQDALWITAFSAGGEGVGQLFQKLSAWWKMKSVVPSQGDVRAAFIDRSRSVSYQVKADIYSFLRRGKINSRAEWFGYYRQLLKAEFKSSGNGLNFAGFADNAASYYKGTIPSGLAPDTWVLGAPQKLGPLNRQVIDHELLHTMQDYHFSAFSSWQAQMPNPVGMFVRAPYEIAPSILGDPLIKGPALYGMYRVYDRLLDNVMDE